jgi:hypothetical protein
MKYFRVIIIFLTLAILLLLLSKRFEIEIFYHPDKLVPAYINSILDADIRKSKFLETGKKDALDEFFGVLTSQILAAYQKAQKISRDEVSFTFRLKSEDVDKKNYEIKFERLDIGFLVDKILEYRGYEENIDGKMIVRPPKYPNLTRKEIRELVLKNEKIPIFTKILSVEVIKNNNMWFISKADEIWYYLHPDLEQYRKIVSK